MIGDSRGRVRVALRTMLAVSVFVGGTVLLGGAADAGPSGSSCSSSQKGCVRMYCCIDTYQFNSDDSSLGNNYYFCEGNVPGCNTYSVGSDFGKYKKNLTSYVRFCQYASTNYSTAVSWVTQTNVWAYSPAPHQAGSLRFRTTNTC